MRFLALKISMLPIRLCVVAAACCDSLNLIAQALVCVCRFSCRSFALEIEISISIVMVFNLYDNHW